MTLAHPESHGSDGDWGGAATPLPVASGQAPASAARWWRRIPRWQLLFAAPSICLVAIFFILPFIMNAGFAFAQWTGYSQAITWTGFDNFRTLNDLDMLAPAVKATLEYAVVAMVVQNTVSLSLASTLQDTTRVNTVFRSLFFLPVLISPLAAGYIWAGMVDPSGPVNHIIGMVAPGFNYAWLGHSTSALVTVASIDAWKWSGLITLVYIAGLNAIPGSLLEAATIDGANAWSRFWRVKFPLLAPAFTFNVVVTFVGAFSAYDVIVATTLGGPGNATTVLNVAMWRQWGQGYFGTASALSFTVTLLVICTAVPLVAWLRGREVAA